jgi:hypothetical protein
MPFARPGFRWRIILKWILNKQKKRECCSGYGQVKAVVNKVANLVVA